jgi:hypothetical protein
MSVPKALAPARPLAVSLGSWLAGAIALSFCLQIWLAFTRQINWDEFWFLTRIYQYRHGDLTDVLQTAYVHAFTWLAYVSGNVIGRIVAGRALMLGFEAGTFLLIYNVARRFASREAALLGLLAYATLNDVFIHGAAFRADPIATFFLMASVALYLVPNFTWKSAIGAALAVAIAGLVTIKAVFYLPVIAAIVAWRFIESGERRAFALRLGIGVAISAAFFAIAYALHSASLAPAQASLATIASGTAETAFASGAFARTWPYMSAAIIGNPATFAAIALGIKQCVPEKPRLRSLVLLSFAFPLATLFFYRNSFPYYYPFALAPAAVVAALAFDRMQNIWERAAWGLACIIFLGTQFSGALSPGQGAQRATLAAVRAIFPQPVPYIDRCGMISDYPRIGFFMSSWGIESYRAAGVPAFTGAIAHDNPPLFVIADTPVLQDAFIPGSADIGDAYKLLPQDARALGENYVHHWGAIWVAGKDLGQLGNARSVSIAIAGRYTIEAAANVIIDNVRYKPSSVIGLSRGLHEIGSAGKAQHVILRWGDHLARPTSPPPGELFDGF